MTKVLAAITTSVDGYITGPNDGPGKGLGDGGERLHYWVFGGPWTYDTQPKGKPSGEDAAWLAQALGRVGAVVGGRGTYEAAGHWGDENPWGLPFFIVTHRPEEEPAGGAFTFVSGVDAAVELAVGAASGKDVNIMGGADIIRQALEAGLVDELSIVVAPLVLGGGKRLFDGFSGSFNLEHLGVRQSPPATFIDYRINRPE
jgi:dihydrofolate reductase